MRRLQLVIAVILTAGAAAAAAQESADENEALLDVSARGSWAQDVSSPPVVHATRSPGAARVIVAEKVFGVSRRAFPSPDRTVAATLVRRLSGALPPHVPALDDGPRRPGGAEER